MEEGYNLRGNIIKVGGFLGLRFRKSINLGGGFRINLSKSGVGYSWGAPGLYRYKC